MDIVSNKDAANGIANGCMNKLVDVLLEDCRKVEDHVNGKIYSDSNSLLPLPKREGIARKLNKTCRRVQWNDTLGKKLVEVLEYEPRSPNYACSDDSDSEDEDSCICSIM